MGRHKTRDEESRHAAARVAWPLAFIWLAVLLFPLALWAADVVVLDVSDAITPPVASYLIENIDKAVIAGREAVIIRLDTPGGLDTAMRDIIQKELNADIPVIVYVAPKGARAASAGALITLAADVAAMAPGTNIGAAHPVSIGTGEGAEGQNETMAEKITNDAVAYAKSIARAKGRNGQWAEDAVRKSISTPAEEARDLKVIEIVARDMGDLLDQLHGRVIKKDNSTFTLDTRDANTISEPMGLRYRLLSAISNPNIAYILMLIGMAGIFFELSNPGLILPGVIGGISLILAFFAFQTLPVNYAGVALMILAVILFIAEIMVPSFGMLTIGGVVSMVLGSVLLFRTPEIYAQVSLGIIVPVTILFTAFFVTTLYLVVRTHRTRSVSGSQGMIGERARVYSWSPDGATGKVFCHGEYWNARGPLSLQPGDEVEVEGIEGLILTVRPVTGADSSRGPHG
ncbi:MAG: nodulation protein NfeD [Desulfomonilia bacterium]|jgi:membrane-bound serine protease (ClpP class)|nr:nodulation protein NfeD [Deltaproteobacteria bacterium]MDX9760499.1 nodulation protein NfeD [Desulfomonilia bacterium]HPW68877.1 nodulation protein NfeD [Deltaproteobacteria bacterium]